MQHMGLCPVVAVIHFVEKDLAVYYTSYINKRRNVGLSVIWIPKIVVTL